MWCGSGREGKEGRRQMGVALVCLTVTGVEVGLRIVLLVLWLVSSQNSRCITW
jgi:hypothetical protein